MVVTKPKVLVLGYFDNTDISQDLYIYIVSYVFRRTNYKLTFKHIEDCSSVTDSDWSVVLCCGYDTINQAFLHRVYELVTHGFNGRTYLLSSSIKSQFSVAYLDMFDHVFITSTEDYNIVKTYVGEGNVSLLPDLICGFRSLVSPDPLRNDRWRIALVIRQSSFPALPSIIQTNFIANVCSSLSDLANELTAPLQVNCLTFDYSDPQTSTTSDTLFNTALLQYVSTRQFPFTVTINRITTQPLICMQQLKRCHAVLTDDYLATILANVIQLPCIFLNHNSRISQLLRSQIPEFDANIFDCSVTADTDNLIISVDASTLTTRMQSAFRMIHFNAQSVVNLNTNHLLNVIFKSPKAKIPYVRVEFISLHDTLAFVKSNVVSYLQLNETQYQTLLYLRSKMMPPDQDFVKLAAILSFCITRSFNNSFTARLATNMQHNEFILFDAILTLWNEHYNAMEPYVHEVQSIGYISNRNLQISLDNDILSDFSEYHRSGWGYALDGLRHFEGMYFLREEKLTIDTYADRTFHWCEDMMLTNNYIPYTKPWVGFIHHTFDTTYSAYNVSALMEKTSFLSSLPKCHGLIALTQYVANDLRQRLSVIGHTDIPVFVMQHPTEAIDCKFSPTSFANNPNKKILQIGAWLRDTYAIFKLGLYSNPLHLQKAALIGRGMSNYYKPLRFMDNIQDYLFSYPIDGDMTSISGNPVISGNLVTTSGNSNKYCIGLYNQIKSLDDTVEILDIVSNDDYDALLSENIVFLYLYDCSAVNTVLECIVRNTPLFVNRHPALEEVLGVDYPGFYDDMYQVGTYVSNMAKITEIYNYMVRMDKRRLTLEHFAQQFANILTTLDISNIDG